MEADVERMRIHFSLVLALWALGCSEPHIDLHLIRSADSPLKTHPIEPTRCENCAAYSWVWADGASVGLQVEAAPYLSLPAGRLSDAEIVHSQWLYRPHCESFTLTFRVGMSLAEMTKLAEQFGGLPTAAMVNGAVLDVQGEGREMLNGETLTLAFGAKQEAVEAAESLGASPHFREADDSWRAGAIEQRREMLDELFSNPEQLQRLADEHGLRVEDLDKERFSAQLFCP